MHNYIFKLTDMFKDVYLRIPDPARVELEAMCKKMYKSNKKILIETISNFLNKI
jgi:hypothetical protein